ncbi:uncharacterized protein LOC111354508 [Spodoptera litura]|uniref:Uncharacterized protein LOC111354508 n=1 Tax=Spodoptera litura TaxID=69820 RepID=A0A9J7E3S3_SPOLT|nr:uncharacterized protein LOC111354508 [Spodoptera litura]
MLSIKYIFILATILKYSYSAYVISIYGDVYKDEKFFRYTFPWIIDNIGGDIYVDYFMVGSGRYSVPQMCALKELKANTYLQAQYLKCEAEGKQSEYCLCETGIDPKKFKQCVASGGSMASSAAAKFSQLGVDTTPIVEIGPRGTVFGVDDTLYLKKICTIFGENQPRGCLKPFDCNQTEVYPDKKALAQFDKTCVDGNQSCDLSTTTTTTTPMTNVFENE